MFFINHLVYALAIASGPSIMAAQVLEFGAPEEIDVAGSFLQDTGIRAFAISARVAHGPDRGPGGKTFLVIADSASRTYWWMMSTGSKKPGSPPVTWSMLGRACHLERTPTGFTLFYLDSHVILVASSRGRFSDQTELATLVRRDFDATAGRPLLRGFGFVDTKIDLRQLLGRSFFDDGLSANIAHPKLESTTRSSDGTWELIVSAKQADRFHNRAYIKLARDLSVESHRVSAVQ